MMSCRIQPEQLAVQHMTEYSQREPESHTLMCKGPLYTLYAKTGLNLCVACYVLVIVIVDELITKHPHKGKKGNQRQRPAYQKRTVFARCSAHLSSRQIYFLLAVLSSQ
jgi:hypothetical protein